MNMEQSHSNINMSNTNHIVSDDSSTSKDNNITVNILGGLGNQMFEIATMYSLAYKYNLKPVVEKISESFKKRAVYWDSVMHKVNYVDSKEFADIKFDYSIKELSPAYQHMILSQNNSYKIIGHFQSAKYFEEYRDKILDLFTLPESMELIVKMNFHKLKTDLLATTSEEKSEDIELVSIHVRRGDYMNIQYFLPVQTIDYFNAGIEIIKSKTTKKCKFIIFSEDMEWCKANFKQNDIYFMNYDDFEVDKNKIPYEVFDMYMMSMMDHYIISNSTFSWWGTWLCRNKNKQVVAPSRWFTQIKMNNDIKTIYEDGWIVI